MASFQLWPLMLMIIVACWPSNAIPKYHYHRYMLSDYRPQHNPNTQTDYKPLPRPSYPGVRTAERGKEPQLARIGSDAKVNLHEILVRIYGDNKFLCMGTLITEQTVLTAAKCFADVNVKDLTIKTFTDNVIPLYKRNTDVQPLLPRDSLVSLLALREPVPQLNITTQLCQFPLRAKQEVELPTYIRSRRKVHNQITEVMPLPECRQMLNDTDGDLVTDMMICVKNKKNTSTCQNTLGNPLIYDGQICGVNISGHNCPTKTDVDLYASVMNEEEFYNKIITDIIESKIEEFML